MTALAVAASRTSPVHLPAAGWAAASFVLLYLLGVGTAEGQQLDEATMRWTAAALPQTGWAEALLTGVSAGSVLLTGAALAIVIALTRGLRVAVLGVLTATVVLLGAEALKLALTRPALSPEALMNSFPSGHVAAVAGLAAALVMAAPAGRRRRAALAAVTPVVTLTGLATVVLEWHRPSDVVGSMLLGVTVGIIAAWWESRTADRRPALSPAAAAPCRRRRLAFHRRSHEDRQEHSNGGARPDRLVARHVLPAPDVVRVTVALKRRSQSETPARGAAHRHR